MRAEDQTEPLGRALGLVLVLRQSGPPDDYLLAALLDAEVELEALGISTPVAPSRHELDPADPIVLLQLALALLDTAGDAATADVAVFLREALRLAVAES